MKPVAQLTIEMAANIARLQKDMEAAKRTVGSAMSQIEKTAGMAMKALGALGAGLSAAAFAGWIKGAIDAMDKTEELSQKVGVAVKDLAGLQLAFKMGGVEADALQIALQKLSTGLTEGNAGLKAMGISAKNADGSLKSTREVLAAVADEFASYQDGAQKTALAIEVFGKSGADLLPILNGGSEALADFDEMARKLGITLDQETAEKAAQFNDTLDLIKTGFQGLAQNLAVQILPFLQDLADRFFDAMREGDRMATIGKVLGYALKGLGAAAIAAADGFKILGLYMGGYAGAFSELISGNFSKAYEIITQTGRSVLTTLQNSVKDIGALFENTGENTIKVFGKFESEGRKLPPVFGAAADAAKKAADEYAKMIEKADELVASLEFETRALEMDNQERETAIQLRKLEALGIERNTELYAEYAQKIMDQVAISQSVKDRLKMEEDLQKKRIKLEEEYAKEVEQINNQIGQSLTDALMQGGMNAKEFLINMFKTMILRPVLQPIITGVVGAMGIGGAGAAFAGTGSTGASGGYGLASIFSSAKSAVDMITSGFAYVGDTVAFALQDAGAWLVNNTTGMLNSAGATLMESSVMLGTAAEALSGIGIGIGIGNLISGGKSLIGGNSMWTTGGGAALGTAIGSIVPGIGTAIGGAIGGIVGGIVNAAFGSGKKEYTDSGIRGQLSAMGADLQEYQKWKKAGGWFTSTKRGTEFNAISNELKQGLDSALGQITLSVAYFAQTLGQPLDVIKSFTQDVNISFKDLSSEQITQEIEKAVKGFETGLINAIMPWINGLANAGENIGDTLKRVSGNMMLFNNTLDMLGFKMFDVFQGSAELATSVVNAFGGQEQFSSAFSAYYEKFYTTQEKIAYQTKSIQKVFEDLNLTMPKTRQEFRDMANMAQWTGNYEVFTTLVKIAPAFDALQTSMEQLGQGTTDITGIIADNSAELRRIADERAGLEKTLLQMQGDTAELRRRELDALDPSNRALQEQIYALEDATAAQEKLTSNTNFFYENFFSLQEKIAQQTNDLTTSFAGLGSALPKTKEEFRALVEAAQAAGDQTLVAGLLALAPEFINLNTAIQQLNGTTTDSTENINDLRNAQIIAQERYSLETQLLQLQGNVTELRRRELETIDPTNKSIQELIWSLEDAAIAANTAKQEEERLSSERERIAQERNNIETRLLQIQGNVSALRERELSALDESNRALQQQIYNLEDAAAAQEELANNTKFFYENFFSLTEQTNKQSANLAQTFAQLGKSLPATKEAFRALVESAQAAGDQALVSALLRLAPEFVSLQNNLASLGQAVGDTTDSIGDSVRDLQAIAQQRYQLETQLLQLQNNITELRRRELEQIDESNKSLQEQIWQTEDQNSLNQQRLQLENQLLQLQGNTAELRKRELEALDPANRALQEQIWAMQDAAAASQSAADAARDAAAAEEERRRSEEEQRRAAEEARQLMIQSLKESTDAAFGELQKTLDFDLKQSLDALSFKLKTLSDAFNTTIDQIRGAVERLNSASTNTDFAFNRISESIRQQAQQAIASYLAQYEAQKSNIENQIKIQNNILKSANDYVNVVKGLFDTLKSSISDLTSQEQRTVIVSSSMQLIAESIALARTGGRLTNIDAIREAVGVATTGVSQASYGSSFESARANALLRNQLIELQGFTSNELTVAEKQVSAAEKQIELLQLQLNSLEANKEANIRSIEKQAEDQIKKFQEQIDEVRGLHETTMSMSEMIEEFNNAILIEQQYANELQEIISSEEKIDRELMIKLAEDQIKYLQDQIALAEKQHQTDVDAANAYKDQTLSYYQEQINLLRGIDTGIGSIPGAISGLQAAIAAERNRVMVAPATEEIPALMTGGAYDGGLALVGEQGPELIDFGAPGMVYSNNQLKNAFSGADTAAEVRALREENRAQAKAMVALQARMTRLIERWDGDGLPEERVVTA